MLFRKQYKKLFKGGHPADQPDQFEDNSPVFEGGEDKPKQLSKQEIKYRLAVQKKKEAAAKKAAKAEKKKAKKNKDKVSNMSEPISSNDSASNKPLFQKHEMKKDIQVIPQEESSRVDSEDYGSQSKRNDQYQDTNFKAASQSIVHEQSELKEEDEYPKPCASSPTIINKNYRKAFQVKYDGDEHAAKIQSQSHLSTELKFGTTDINQEKFNVIEPTRIKSTKDEDNLLKQHNVSYQNYRKKYDDELIRKYDYEQICNELKNPIKCVKYNYSLEEEIQNHLQFDATLRLSDDGKRLIIINKKPNTNPEYIFEPDPHQVKQAQDEWKLEQKQKDMMVKRSLKRKLGQNNNEENQQQWSRYHLNVPDKHDDDVSASSFGFDSPTDFKKAEEQHDDEKELERMQAQYIYQQSSSSCDISNIQGFIYGGYSSRFWLFRKHLMCIDYNTIKNDTKQYKEENKNKDKKNKIPFYAWQCITLILSNRQVDLVIKSEDSMNLFLRFLVIALNTQTGDRGDAERNILASYYTEIRKRERELIRQFRANKHIRPTIKASEVELTNEQKEQIMIQKRREIYRQTIYKYTLMKIRSKIAYQAYQNRMSINEIMLTQILRSYEELTSTGSIPPIANYPKPLVEYFDLALGHNEISILDVLFNLNGNPIIKQRKAMLYRGRELKQLGVKSLDDITDPVLRENFVKLVKENISRASQQPKEKMDKQLNEALNNFNNNNCLESETTRIEINEHYGSEVSNRTAKLEDNVDQWSRGFGCADKDRCEDLMEHVVVDDLNMYENRSARVKFRNKFNRKIIEGRLNNIKFMLGCGELIDIFFIKCSLLRIQLIKSKFILEMEQGQEVFIPSELSCDSYPTSFRYYDPIIQITNHLMSTESKLYHQLKTQFNISKIQGSNWQRDFLIRVGIMEHEKKRKLTHKHSIINLIDKNEVKHTETNHPWSLQKSRYLIVESNEDRLRQLAEMQDKQLRNVDIFIETEIVKGARKSIEDKYLNMRFCHGDEVNLKRQKFIRFKQGYYQRQDHLKKKGQKFHTVCLFQKYIEDNIDELFKNRNRDDDLKRQPQRKSIPNSGGLNKSIMVKDLEQMPYKKLTPKQKLQIEKEKKKYADWLLTEFENMVESRRLNMRVKLVDEIYEESGIKVAYMQKNTYLEQRIETVQKYFDYMNDLNNKGAEMMQIRKDLFKVNKAIEINKANNPSKIDPYEILQKKNESAADASAAIQASG